MVFFDLNSAGAVKSVSPVRIRSIAKVSCAQYVVVYLLPLGPLLGGIIKMHSISDRPIRSSDRHADPFRNVVGSYGRKVMDGMDAGGGVSSWQVAIGAAVTFLAIGYIGRIAKQALDEVRLPSACYMFHLGRSSIQASTPTLIAAEIECEEGVVHWQISGSCMDAASLEFYSPDPRSHPAG